MPVISLFCCSLATNLNVTYKKIITEREREREKNISFSLLKYIKICVRGNCSFEGFFDHFNCAFPVEVFTRYFT